jgi:hypothetical protein
MKKYDIVSWFLGLPFSVERVEFQNDHQAIGYVPGLIKWNVHQSGCDWENPVHIYRMPSDGSDAEHSVSNFVAAWIPANQGGQIGIRLNHPAGQGRMPDDRDLVVHWGDLPPHQFCADS